MKAYEFVTIWRVKAPIENVWKEIYHSNEWSTWWKGVENVIEVRKGDERGVGGIHRYTWKSKLPYRLSFDMQTIRVEPPLLLFMRRENLQTLLNGCGRRSVIRVVEQPCRKSCYATKKHKKRK